MNNTLTKYRLGDLIELCTEKNQYLKYAIDDVKGISINKTFIETKADMNGVSLKPYKLVKPDCFAYGPDTSRNGDKISLAYNDSDSIYIVSSSYVVFKIINKDILLSEYLFMFFNRPEFDRYARFNSWGTTREMFSWSEMQDIEIEIPPVEIQQKYVDIYKSMVENQKCYETALDDLKLVCDAYIEDLRKKFPCEPIGKYIRECNEKNTDGIITLVQGVESSGIFVGTRAKMAGIDISKYKVVSEKDFAYNPSRINLGSIALRSNGQCIVSPMYTVFRIINNNKLNPEYLSLWLSRKEFHRSTLFYATGSVRDTFDFSLMKDVEIPIPDIKIQRSIADIYKVYMERRQINEKLKEQIKNICPVLIRGAVKETKRRIL